MSYNSKSYRTDGSKSYYKKDYSENSNKGWTNSRSHYESQSYSKYENTKNKKGYEWRETFYPTETNNHSNEYKTHHTRGKIRHTTSRKKESSNTNHSQSIHREKGSEKRDEKSFLDYIGIETDEKTISKRQGQIDIAKASYAYTRYSMFINKDQRITDMPQTPNKYMKTDTQSWMQTVKKWVHQLRQWEVPGTPSLPSPVWIPEKQSPPKFHHKPKKSPTPSSPIESDSIESGEYFEKLSPKKEVFYEKKIERKRKRSYSPTSPPRIRKLVYDSSPKYKRSATTPYHHSKYPHHTYKKKSNYEAFSHSQDFEHESPRVERKVSYVKDYGPRFSHPSREANFHRKDDLRYKMKRPPVSPARGRGKSEYVRNSHDQRSYTNISWSPIDSPNDSLHLHSRSHRHISPYGRPRSVSSLPRDRVTSPITPPPMRKERTPEFDIPGQQWQMENELVLIEDV